MVNKMTAWARLTLAACLIVASVAGYAKESSFEDFDRRAKAGERLSVVFFGASLTWGANASDPQLYSYRAQVAKRLEAKYPAAHFHFWDGAIGGTGSQLAVFRFDRDVLAHQPDLVFLDFSANDGINDADTETLASYEALVRRVITDAHAPLVQVIFPFMWDVQSGDLSRMKRREAHLKIAAAYGAGAGDAIALAIDRIKAGETTLKKIWPADGVHPCDEGYILFADAAWQAFEQALKDRKICAAPEKMLFGDTYMHSARVKISSLGKLPEGWKIGRPNLVSAFFDMLMSRWLDDETIVTVPKTPGSAPARLKVKFNGSMVLFFGESTPTSCKYRVYIDGKQVEHEDNKKTLPEFDAGGLGKRCSGNVHHTQRIAQGLDPSIEHTLEIEPLPGTENQEMRLESICVAGGEARVVPCVDK